MRFVFETHINSEVSKVFAFHEDPDNLKLLNRNRKSFRMIKNDRHVKPGAVTRVSERFLFFSFPMTFEHICYEPPHRFGERLMEGCFSKFEHTHEFHANGGGTVLRDRLVICLPWYLGGELAMNCFVAPVVRKAFRDRRIEFDRLASEGIFR